jgi:tRNA(fMet)-specific endonuclease VapC
VSFLLDTDICSAFMKGNRTVWQKCLQHGGQLHVSAITVGELFTWVFRKGVSAKREDLLGEFLKDVTTLNVTEDVARKCGELRASRFDAGKGTPDMDLFIAATALVHNFTLVTHNVQDYDNIQGLRIVDWLIP